MFKCNTPWGLRPGELMQLHIPSRHSFPCVLSSCEPSGDGVASCTTCRRVRSDLACHPAWPLLADSLPAVRRDLVRAWVPCTKCFLRVTTTVQLPKSTCVPGASREPLVTLPEESAVMTTRVWQSATVCSRNLGSLMSGSRLPVLVFGRAHASHASSVLVSGRLQSSGISYTCVSMES